MQISFLAGCLLFLPMKHILSLQYFTYKTKLGRRDLGQGQAKAEVTLHGTMGGSGPYPLGIGSRETNPAPLQWRTLAVWKEPWRSWDRQGKRATFLLDSSTLGRGYTGPWCKELGKSSLGFWGNIGNQALDSVANPIIPSWKGTANIPGALFQKVPFNDHKWDCSKQPSVAHLLQIFNSIHILFTREMVTQSCLPTMNLSNRMINES